MILSIRTLLQVRVSYAHMVMRDLLVAAGLMKAVWRYVTSVPGARFVILSGTALMQALSADSWDLHMKVYLP